MLRKRLPAWLCLLMLAGSAAAQAESGGTYPGISEKVLDNGLKVLVKEDHRAPVVVSQIWYKVGSSYEPEGLTGISHVLEHMMFKGTKSLGPNEFSRIIANNGGEENAFTGRDYTAYYERLASDRLEIALKLEAERMQNLELDPDEFKKEVQVVLEERRLRTEDRPESLTYEKFANTAYEESRYGNPVIGWPEDLRSLTVADLEDWYKRFYAPNNATLVVVGDVQPQTVFELAEKHFGPIPSEEVRPYPDPQASGRENRREVTVEAPATVPYLLIGFNVPNLGEENEEPWEPYALEVLAHLLSGGKTARLDRRLIRERQVAASVGAGYDLAARLDTLFIVEANPASGRSVEEVEAAILSVVKDLKETLVSDEELGRVKTQLVASKVFQTDSIFYQGVRLGRFETNGHGWRKGQQLTERLREVTAEQLRAVARKYLVDGNMTVAVLSPTAMKEGEQ